MSWLDFWHWMALGAVLAVAEMLLPGAFLLWLGLAAIGTGFVKLLVPAMGLEGQLFVFGVLTLAALAGWFFWWRKRGVETDLPNLNERGRQMIGRVLVLDEGLVNGEGFARIGDTIWKVRGADFVKGARVKVVGFENNVLMVDKV
jgi:hypothetical protein